MRGARPLNAGMVHWATHLHAVFLHSPFLRLSREVHCPSGGWMELVKPSAEACLPWALRGYLGKKFKKRFGPCGDTDKSRAGWKDNGSTVFKPKQTCWHLVSLVPASSAFPCPAAARPGDGWLWACGGAELQTPGTLWGGAFNLRTTFNLGAVSGDRFKDHVLSTRQFHISLTLGIWVFHWIKIFRSKLKNGTKALDTAWLKRNIRKRNSFSK